MKRKLFLLTSPYFLISLSLLLLNDFLLKQTFHNILTGKISDFAGLFVFPIFFYAFFPKNKKTIFILTGIFFSFWKSELSQPIINFWNSSLLFPIHRTVDYTDLLALMSLPAAYKFSDTESQIYFPWGRVGWAFSFTLSLFAFCATSYQRNFDYENTYDFPYSKEELVRKINSFGKKFSPYNLPLSLNIKHANDFRTEGTDTIWYFASSYKTYTTKTKTADGTRDSAYSYTVPQRDTIYISSSGIFYYLVPAKKYMSESRTGYCDFVNVKLKINGSENASRISLVQIKTHNCMGMFEKEAERHEKDNLQKAFETEVVATLLLR